MIRLLRIDDRLLHGQVALTWIPALGVDCILVANDKVAIDEFQKMALSLAKPFNVKLLIKSIEETVAILNDSRYKLIKLLVIVNSVKDSCLLTEQVDEIKSVNFGGIRAKEGSKPVSKAISLTDSDLELVKLMIEKGLELEVRQVPTDKKLMLADLI